MSASPVLDRPLTMKEFDRIPDVGKRYELEYGRLVETPPVSNEQSCLGSLIIHDLLAFVGRRRWRCVFDSSVRFRLARDPDLIRGPDVSYVPPDRLPPLPWPDGAMDVVPALAVEIVSSSNTAAQIEDKVDEYLRAGVDLVWVVYPRHQRVYARDSAGNIQLRRLGEVLDGAEVLPGFKLPLDDLFAEPS